VRKLIFGCGYLGQRVARRWRAAGHEVTAVTRNPARAEQLEGEGIRAVVADVLTASSLPTLADFDSILFAIGYDRASRATMRQVYVEGLSNVLAKLSVLPRRFLYISSTGVYGDRQGAWIDERTECRPVREGGIACLEAEQRIAQHACGPVAVILRLAGLYGPGRIPRRHELVANRPIAAPAEGYLNLIHVDDAAQTVLTADTRAEAPNLFVVSDGHPVSRAEYYRELARLVAAPPPRFVAPAEHSPAAERAAASRRIRNEKMLRDLGITLQYPSYREGLAAIVATEDEATSAEGLTEK
jgi:nucleoside-diphosphate-sugar epimerase